MIQGVRFQIPNEHGRYIADILEPVDCSNYKWKVESSTEIWKVANGKLGDELLSNDIIDGKEFLKLITNNRYYLIFATLKAFPQNVLIVETPKYKEFLSSNCDIAFIVADCSYVCLFCKSTILIRQLYTNAKAKGFKDVEYINENDNVERMYIN